MAIIPSGFINSVVALGINLPDNKKHWIGTGFIVGRKEKNNPAMSTHYLITNKHVVSSVKEICVRFNSVEGAFVKDYPISLYDEKGAPLFSPHPIETTDIIALQISPQQLIKDKSIWGSFDLDDHALTLDQMQSTGVEEGSLVYALGFPMNLVETIKVPICRLGCVSRITDAFILKDANPIFLVDAQTFPGNSGGPVINRPEAISITGTPTNTTANLIGVLCSYIPYRETLYSRQTDRDRMVQEENSGLTIVHPVDRIKEVVELERERVETQRRESSSVANSDETQETKEEVTV